MAARRDASDRDSNSPEQPLDGDLLRALLERLEDGESALDAKSDGAAALVLAALLGEVDAHLEGAESARPEPDATARHTPPQAWLRSITVCGFRGVGEACTLELEPTAGLTVVLGRNGSGKSSFAEAAELLFTGRNSRWDGRPKAWADGWRNLHHEGSRSIDAVVRVDGEAGATTLQRTWDAKSLSLDDAETQIQRPPDAPPLERLGWSTAAVTYRPFLSYNELGSLIEDSPSRLHDALAGILGLDALVTLADDLRQRRLDTEKPIKDAEKTAKDLAHRCEQLAQPTADADAEAAADPSSGDPRPTDERFAQAAALLGVRGKQWDLDALRQLLADRDDETAPPDADADGTHDSAATAASAPAISPRRAAATLAAFEPLDRAAYTQSLEDLRAAQQHLHELSSGEAGRAEQLLRILEPALEHVRCQHPKHQPTADSADLAATSVASVATSASDSDSTSATRTSDASDATADATTTTTTVPCPVCGQTPLDAAWQASATEQIERLRAQVAELAAARDAEAAARAALPTPPPVEPLRTLDAPAALLAWSERLTAVRSSAPSASAGPASAPSLSEPSASAPATSATITPATPTPDSLLTSASTDLDLLDELLLHAGHLHQQSESVWQPVRRQLEAWLPTARQTLDARPLAARFKEAEAWLRDQATQLYNERFAPIAEAVRQNWDELRTASNVSLEEIRFAGKATRRTVELDVTVDGLESPALSVMSQGELNALALSLFLPRATLDRSPFRFVVIDDPVQAMDPARVDGLAQVLERTARTRQVIVFTHDDRLAESIRRLQIKARLLEVRRGERSQVSVHPRSDEVQRAFDEAYALIRTEKLPPSARDRVVPGLCRVALEEAALEAFRRRRLGRGEPHLDVQETIEQCDKLLPKVALALFDDPGRAGHVLGHLNNSDLRHQADVLMACNKGSHGGLQGAADHQFLRSAKDLAQYLRSRP
ncbi:MAG: hypothetical protein DWQ36_14520 [Acidobacteria bacterium]|nr:MAG: hypothetical protein DWQ30_03255 [Acidobacteriota bacterium]REK06106.1 MAG: hypothetical protein DWQ36_14520 [Acidobacteriota bacterium]